MDIGDFHSGVAQNQALNDLTNSNGKRTRLRTMEQSIHGNCDEKVPEKRKRFSHGRLGRCDQRKEENFRSTKPHETKGKALSFMNANPSNLLGKGYDEPKGPVQIDSISFQGCSSDQENRLKYEADDDSSTVLAPQYNSEADDSSTESDKHKDNYPMTDGAIVGKPFSSPEQNQPAFSMCNIDTLTLTKNAADNDNLTYAKSQYISLCGSCPCSSCVKAAYMWTDLLYQDAKGRLSALYNSRRHASILEGKFLCCDQVSKTSEGQLNDDISTEFDLLQHWSSLFLRTEDIVQREIVETQSRLIEIQNLKENYKRDLEKIATGQRNE